MPGFRARLGTVRLIWKTGWKKPWATSRRHARRAQTSRTRRIFKPWKLTCSGFGRFHHTLQEEIRTSHPDYYALKHPEPAGLEDIQEKTLSPDEFMLVYEVMKESVCLWVIGSKHFGLYAIKIGENKLGQKIISFREGARSILKALSALRGTRESVEAGSRAVSLEGQELYELLMPKDAREALSGAKTLYIVPTGPLYSLPFKALVSRMDGGRPHYLVEDYPIAYLSSASLLKTLRETQARKGAKARFPLLAFANPVYGRSAAPGAPRGEPTVADMRTRAYLNLMGGTFLELPETEEEAREIKTILMAPDSSMSLQLGQDVTEQCPETERGSEAFGLPVCGFLLPRGRSGRDQPGEPAGPCALAARPCGRRRISHHGGYLGLRLNADLVTLSACNTGRGEEVRGEGVMGLTRAFMYAGTSALSVTLWSVESISAKRLSTGLYENLQAGKGRAEALRDIKLRMIHGEEEETYRYPFFWAPVVLFGDGR